MGQRDYQTYKELIHPNIGHLEALEKMNAMTKDGYLLAQSPYDLSNVRVRVACPPERVIHILFKNPNGSRAERLVCEAHYRKSHGERHRWVEEVLLYPNTIRHKLDEDRKVTFLYIAEPCKNEQFVVVVKRFSELRVITAYDADMTLKEERDDFSRLMEGSIQVKPTKKKK